SQTGTPCRPRLRATAMLTCAPPTISAPGDGGLRLMNARVGSQRHRLGGYLATTAHAPRTTARRTGDAPRREARAGDETQQRPETAHGRGADKVQTRYARFKSARQNG